MARKCFFSFHYNRDHWRAWQVRNAWVTKDDRKSAGFFDSSVFESKKRASPDALKQFLTEGLRGCSVTCALMGAETAGRRWVRYELVRSFQQGKGILAVKILGLKNSKGEIDHFGDNPLAQLAYTIDSPNNRVNFKEKVNGQWASFGDLPSMNLSDLVYSIGDKTNHTFSTLFSTHDYTQDGYNKLGHWIELAATPTGR